jgi:hypothetical protein
MLFLLCFHFMNFVQWMQGDSKLLKYLNEIKLLTSRTLSFCVLFRTMFRRRPFLRHQVKSVLNWAQSIELVPISGQVFKSHFHATKIYIPAASCVGSLLAHTSQYA